MRWLSRIFGARPAAARDEPDAWLRTGFDHQSRGDLAEAERCYRLALERDPGDADALYFLGRIAERQLHAPEALALYRKAAQARPDDARIRSALGAALYGAGAFAEAEQAYRAAAELRPDDAGLRSDHAASLIETGRLEEARIELEPLLALAPDRPMVHFNLGGIYREYGRIEQSLRAYRRALELEPDRGDTWSNLLLTLNYAAGRDAASVCAEHRAFGRRFAAQHAAPARTAGRRLRVGYVSPDFRAHVVSCVLEPVLASHDRAGFEVFCYYNHRQHDPHTARLQALAEHWLDCAALSDAALAERIRADRIDILVDLAGHTAGHRLAVFALRPAPVQATWLGYPNTTGLAQIDYRITDPWADPAGEPDRIYAERLVRLPECLLCYRPVLGTAPVSAPPAGAAGRITFGCFNNFSKLTGAFFDAAARVLGAVPGSRLILKGEPLEVAELAHGVRERFARAGIGAARLELRGWTATFEEHLAAYGAVDIALDCFPYNGTTTTCEALWMGVPVVTLAGDRCAARMGVSLLRAAGQEELVADTIEQYVAICVRLAGDIARLADERKTMRERLLRSPLMDEIRFTRDLERAYRSIREMKTGPAVAGAKRGAAALADLLRRAAELRAAGRRSEAQEACETILLDRPDHPEALGMLWELAAESGGHKAAIEWLGRAISAVDRVAGTHYMLGCSLAAEGRHGEAREAFRRALALDPALAKAHNNLGCALEALGRIDEAAQCYRAAIGVEPKLAPAHYNLGNACRELGDAARAIDHMRQALALDPEQAEWQSNLGEVLYGQDRLDEALASYNAALAVAPGEARARSGLGTTLLALGRVAKAQAAFRQVLESHPDQVDAHSNLLLALNYADSGPSGAGLEAHLAWSRRHARGLGQARFPGGAARRRRPLRRIGYVSPDFRGHSLARFIEPVLAAHDRDRLEIYGYANVAPQDGTTQRLRGLCSQWRDIRSLNDEEAAERIRADRVDILVDLAGHARGGRLLVFARKPAPVQVGWLGYPNTTGLEAIDYRLTDLHADPQGESEPFYSERLVHLAHGFLCYGAPAESPDVGDLPALQSGGVTFGCLSELARVTPRMIGLWARILDRLPRSRLLLRCRGLSAQSAQDELHARFSGHGIGPGRLVIVAPERAFDRHLAGYRMIDVCLDVFPYNDATTTCEALWMGVPVVTLAGRTHASRVGKSLLEHAGRAELVADAPDAYVGIALSLARDQEKLGALRGGLRQRLRSSALMDARAFTAGLEAAYRSIWAA